MYSLVGDWAPGLLWLHMGRGGLRGTGRAGSIDVDGGGFVRAD